MIKMRKIGKNKISEERRKDEEGRREQEGRKEGKKMREEENESKLSKLQCD